ncbi:MAG: ATP-binding protein [Flavobacteriales bacterium]
MPIREVSILLLEDHPGDARLVREFLRETEFADSPLLHVVTLAQAVAAELDPSTPHCALVDLTLPDAHGARVLRAVQEAHPLCAVIALTGLEDEDMAITALKGGAQGYLEKSRLSADELGREIRGSIERHGFLRRLREADRAAFARERRFSAMMEHSSDITIMTNASGVVTYLSPMAERKLGRLAEDGGKRIAGLFDPADREQVRSAWDLSCANAGKPMPLIVRAARRLEGRQIWLEGTIIDLVQDAEVGAMVLNLHDITARHEMTEALRDLNSSLERRVEQRTIELRRLEADLRVALAAEQEINEMRLRFVSMASHEFRTPLGGIMGSAELIEGYLGRDEAKAAKHVAKIKQRVRDMTAILQNFLSLEKLEKGLEQVNPEPFCLMQLVRELIDELQLLLKPGQRIEHTHEGDNDAIDADRRLLAIVLRNLLSNASKYSPNDRVIRISTSLHARMVEIQVADQGIGIPKQDQKRLFEQFYRASNAVGVQGTGLGLHIVRRYVLLLGGSLRFTSVEGEGTTFSLELPVNSAVIGDQLARGQL